MHAAKEPEEVTTPEEVPTYALRAWIESHTGNRHFGAERKKGATSVNYGTGNGNHEVIIEKPLRLEYPGAEPLLVPAGSSMMIYRRFDRSISTDVVAVIFARTFQAKVFGSGKVAIKVHSR